MVGSNEEYGEVIEDFLSEFFVKFDVEIFRE